MERAFYRYLYYVSYQTYFNFSIIQDYTMHFCDISFSTCLIWTIWTSRILENLNLAYHSFIVVYSVKKLPGIGH